MAARCGSGRRRRRRRWEWVSDARLVVLLRRRQRLSAWLWASGCFALQCLRYCRAVRPRERRISRAATKFGRRAGARAVPVLRRPPLGSYYYCMCCAVRACMCKRRASSRNANAAHAGRIFTQLWQWHSRRAAMCSLPRACDASPGCIRRPSEGAARSTCRIRNAWSSQ